MPILFGAYVVYWLLSTVVILAVLPFYLFKVYRAVSQVAKYGLRRFLVPSRLPDHPKL